MESNLARFNRLVLKFQDEAYTLAWYLFGSDEPASEAVQAAVLHLYRSYPLEEGHFRIQVLHHVWQQGTNRCLRLPIPGTPCGGSGFPRQPLTSRQARLHLLVSVLGLDYRQAAQVVGCSRDVFIQEIAAADQALCARSGDPTRSSTPLENHPPTFDIQPPRPGGGVVQSQIPTISHLHIP